MNDYGRIVLATDLSAQSEWAALRAASLAQTYGAELILLMVIEHFPEERPASWVPPEDVPPEKFFEDRANRRLDELMTRIGAPQARKAVRTTTGSARRVIVQFAAEQAADLVVLGRHGEGFIDRLVLGSTAAGVVQDAGCDVLVVAGE